MGLKCSLFGHAYEAADTERERQERGSEVVTISREIERCRRCGEERIVSESTEVAAVVDADDVDLDTGAGDSSPDDVDDGSADGFGGVVERSDVDPPDVGSDDGIDEPPDPEEEDAEILSETPDRNPGEWPEESEESADDDMEPIEELAEPPEPQPDEEPSAGLTVPEGEIVCPGCGFRIDAESSFRDGDPCPECGDWLSAERNP